MDILFKEHGHTIIMLLVIVIASVLGALYKLGWIRPKPRKDEWDGHERRECALHPLMDQKVCSLHSTLEDVEIKMGDVAEKLDNVAEKVQFILGLVEAKWGKLSK